MGKKHIIEIEDDRNIIETFNGKCTLAVSARLGNTEVFIDTNIPVVPYTEPDLDAIKQEEYEKGYKTAKVQCDIQTEKDLREVGERHYQKGLSDAWEAAKKICANWCISDDDLALIFGKGKTIDDIMREFTATEAIEKIRQYEQEKKEIKVGDEVTPRETEYDDMIVTRLWKDDYDSDCIDAIGFDGRIGSFLMSRVSKTGKHYEIAEVLEKMRGEQYE